VWLLDELIKLMVWKKVF